MEETETAKEWFVMREGQQFGPVSFDDLKFEAERGELNPRLDTVWKNGMGDWIPAGELDGLFVRNDEAKAAEKAKEDSKSFTGYIPLETEEERERIIGNWPGVGRGTYFFIIFLFPFLFVLALGAAGMFLKHLVDPALLSNISGLLLLLPVFLSIVVTLQRLQNLGMSRWWFFGLFVPVLNLWLHYRLFACPPGHAYERKLDGLGWFLATFYWVFTLLIGAAVSALIYISVNEPDKLKEILSGKDAQEFIQRLEEARERGEKFSEPETPETAE